MKYISDLANDSYVNLGSNNTFTVFKSINEILYLIYSNKNKSIICYDLNQQKKIAEIKKSHNEFITNFRYYYDHIKNRDIIMSISCEDNNLRLWDIKNLECILNIKSAYKDGYLFSACFLNDNNTNNIITSNCNNYGSSEPIKVFDFNGNKIKEINNSNEETLFIDTYYDNITSKIYIITGNNGYIKSYDYNKNELYRKYYDNDNGDHNSLIIKNDDDIIKIIESCFDGNIRIWNFHSGLLLNKIKINNGRLISICLWNNSYLYVGCSDKTIKLVELKNELVIKSLSGHNNNILTIKKVIHPKYGKCLLSQGWENDHIRLWINKD
jgi:WD40 repeat protein